MGTLFDGLGGEEVVSFSGTGLDTLHIFATGSITAGNQISGLNVFAAGSAQAPVTLFTTASGTNFFGAGSVTVPIGIFTNGSVVGSVFTGVITNVTTSGTNVFCAGSATTNVAVIGVNGSVTGSVFAGNISTPNNVHLSVGSPYSRGVVLQMTARSNISGGTWVSASGGLALAGPASAQGVLGVSQPGTHVASGGTVNVIMLGVVPLISEGAIAQGVSVQPGAGAALNCVLAAAAGSGPRFTALDTAGSEGTVFVLIR